MNANVNYTLIFEILITGCYSLKYCQLIISNALFIKALGKQCQSCQL